MHDSGNLLRSWHLRSGDIGQGFARADVVVEQTYRTPFVDHAYLETETGIGWIDAEGVLVLRVSTQVLEHYRDVAEILQIPHGRVRLEGAYLGGGFGGKEDVTVECLLGLLVWKTRRPSSSSSRARNRSSVTVSGTRTSCAIEPAPRATARSPRWRPS